MKHEICEDSQSIFHSYLSFILTISTEKIVYQRARSTSNTYTCTNISIQVQVVNVSSF